MSYAPKLERRLEELELLLDDTLRKKSPLQLPPATRKTLAMHLWWVALVLGTIQLVAVWLLWRAADRVDHLVDFANSVTIYGAVEPAQHLGFIFYVSLALLAIEGLLLIAAYQGLQKYKKQGWNFLFYSMLLNVAAGIVMVFSDYGGGIGEFVRAMFFSVIGAYFLFQVREYFTGITSAGGIVTVEKTSEKTVK